MRGYRFRLQPVLRVRQLQEEQSRIELAMARRAEDEAHAATATRVTAVTFAAGDTVVGAIFYAGTTERAGLVDDLFIDGCTLFVPRA